MLQDYDTSFSRVYFSPPRLFSSPSLFSPVPTFFSSVVARSFFSISSLVRPVASGEAKDFLAFWSQFQKIHNDKSIAEEDKRQYLLQSMEPKSKAVRLVLSFPATAENYPKAMDQLKERFGREDLLVQIYVRELLNLVMKNAVSGRTKTDLSTLYDELEGKLRSLESLGRTQEKYGDFLIPLVESCLPEEILMAWERKRNTETDAKGSRTLEHLVTFLRLEVQGEEMVQLAKSGFGTPIRKRDSPTERVKPTELMTASALTISEKSSGKRKVRVLIDTACENSYISESVTSILKSTPLREETIIPSLFGGNETKPKHHSVFSIEVSDLKRSYACSFEVLSEKKTCGFISKIEDKRILNELKNKEIILTDLNCKETEIGLLIGADNIGKLLTGNLIEFDSGLTAIETKLGWTVIGINKMKILPDGRYEVKLPWKCNSENLSSNKELTRKRHLRMMNKLRNSKFFDDYKSVFRQWEDLNIIERVPEVELNNECHYLPHRPVVKLDSATTKIRPVFDASAREKGKPSLNDC
ncbi:DUF1758 domain-containing protein [Trichonephila clavipes]|nr:DUF1758 domain-containing protein [Trichonephila clavipes]